MMETVRRWAIWKRFTIYKEDEIYLDRLRLVQTPWFGVYLHKIYKPDEDRAVHDHPWAFASWVLRGGYTETFVPAPRQWVSTTGHVSRSQTWRRWSFHRMGLQSAHQIVKVQPKTVTLVLVGRKKKDWGFWPEPGVFVRWQDYLSSENAATTRTVGTTS